MRQHPLILLVKKNLQDESLTIEETEVNFEFEKLLEAFNEMHEEAQKLAISNNKLRSDLK